jgi:hypothetical protein
MNPRIPEEIPCPSSITRAQSFTTRRPAQGLRSSGFRSSPQTTPLGKPMFAGRKGQIEPIGRTPMNVRYTSTPAVR